MSDLARFAQDETAIGLIAELAEELEKKTELEVITRLRKQGLDQDLVRFAIEQATLRHRGNKKFGSKADAMLFTEAALEQATRAEVAAWHASVFVAAGINSLTDLGCGLGSDSMAFLEAGLKVTAVENHPVAFAAASHNLKNFPKATLIHGAAEDASIKTTGLYVDPARRDQDRKSKGPVRLTPEDFSPSLEFVFEQARKHAALIKLSPAFPHELIPKDFEANWVSHQGDLVEVLLRTGSLAEPGVRKAILLGNKVLEFEGVDEEAELAELAEYVFEPDPAIVRSHLIGAFANQNGLRLISKDIAYLTSSGDLESPWLKRYRVLEVLPLSEKDIRRYCTQNNIGTVEIKKRGVDITPEILRPKLKLKGTGAVTLILTKVGDARRAIVCESIR